ncbi:MAG: response regulator [Bacteroidales bacterium]|nr:response regulator [Bacteroidales bacterium]
MHSAFFLLCILLLASCGNNPKGTTAEDVAKVGTDKANVAGPDDTIEKLLKVYDGQGRTDQPATADKIFDLLFREEMTDERITVGSSTPSDSIDMLVWYWAGEHLWTTQDYDEGLYYAEKALPLTYKLGDLSLQSYCERLVGLFYFRRSNYYNAIEHISKSLELSKRGGDKSQVGSSLNTLAGICLAAKQLDDGEKYIQEAIHYCEEANDSNLLPIRYGMASEIYHAKGDDVRSLDYARRAFVLDSLLGKTPRTGIRLSQMAAAQIALKQDAAAERSIRRAIPILEEAGNDLSLSICRNQMGELLNRRGAYAEAVSYFEKAAETFARNNDKYNESRARIGLYESLKESNPREAGQHLRRYAALKDSIYQQDVEQAVSQYNVKYKTEELALKQEQERLEKRAILFGAIALIAILLLIVTIVIYTSRIRQKSHLALKKLSAMREQFFTNITHEFRTPLTVILGLSQDLQANDAADVSDKAQSINRQGKTLLELINQILDIAKVKSAVGKADWRNGNIMAYLTMVVESYRNYSQSHNVQLNFLAKGTVMMDFVPDYINKVVGNLLSNAFKFTPEYGKISVAAWREGDRLLIDVSDTGKGMDKKTLTHIFEPFYQAEDESQQFGTGLGLALVKQIMDAVAGRVSVESKLGSGTTFHLSFPINNKIKKAVGETATLDTALLPDNPAALADSEDTDDRCRLLIIEDNRDIAAYIGAQFADNYAISYAANGDEGLEKAQQLVPDLIITDLMMPGMDGLELCRKVRSNDIINHIPIIVVTARITEEERIRGLEAGADAYLTKPFNEDELRTRVDKLLEGRRLLQQKYAQTATERTDDRQAVSQPVSADLRFLTKVSDVVYMQISRNKSFDVALIASILCMSSRQFHRKMVALTGCTPTAYIQRIKIKKAKTLLDNNPQMNFNEVADQSGFGDYSNFVRAFKNVCGVTPTEYRRRDEQ